MKKKMFISKTATVLLSLGMLGTGVVYNQPVHASSVRSLKKFNYKNFRKRIMKKAHISKKKVDLYTKKGRYHRGNIVDAIKHPNRYAELVGAKGGPVYIKTDSDVTNDEFRVAKNVLTNRKRNKKRSNRSSSGDLTATIMSEGDTNSSSSNKSKSSSSENFKEKVMRQAGITEDQFNEYTENGKYHKGDIVDAIKHPKEYAYSDGDGVWISTKDRDYTDDQFEVAVNVQISQARQKNNSATKQTNTKSPAKTETLKEKVMREAGITESQFNEYTSNGRYVKGDVVDAIKHPEKYAYFDKTMWVAINDTSSDEESDQFMIATNVLESRSEFPSKPAGADKHMSTVTVRIPKKYPPTSSSTTTKNPSTTTPTTPKNTNKNTNTGSVKLDDNWKKDVEKYFIEDVNQWRSQQGIPALSQGDSLMQQVADVRGQEQLTSFGHTRPDGRICFTAASDVGTYFSAECVAYTVSGNPYTAKKFADFEFDQFVYHDADSNWGHRDALRNSAYSEIAVGPSFKKVGSVYYMYVAVNLR